MPEPRRELDAAVAREIFGCEVRYFDLVDTWQARDPDWAYWSTLGSFSTSSESSASVESEIERRGLADLYIHYLMAQVGIDGHKPGYDERDLFAIRRATPEMICRAALKTVRGAGNAQA